MKVCDMSVPDWELWQEMRFVEVWQACALSLSLDPNRMRWVGESETWKLPPGFQISFERGSFPSEAVEALCGKRLQLLVSHVHDQAHFNTVIGTGLDVHKKLSLQDFANWAVNVVHWADLPRELADIAHTPKGSDSASDEQVSPSASGRAYRTDAPAAVALPDAKEAIGTREDGEPLLREGKNTRRAIQAWVTWQANDKVAAGDTKGNLAERIKLIAQRWRFESEKKALTGSNIERMLPPGITGGRRGGRKKK